MNILVSTDFSENALNAFKFIKEISYLHKGEITLLFSYSAIHEFAAQTEKTAAEIEATAKTSIKMKLNQVSIQNLPWIIKLFVNL